MTVVSYPNLKRARGVWNVGALRNVSANCMDMISSRQSNNPYYSPFRDSF